MACQANTVGMPRQGWPTGPRRGAQLKLGPALGSIKAHSRFAAAVACALARYARLPDGLGLSVCSAAPRQPGLLALGWGSLLRA